MKALNILLVSLTSFIWCVHIKAQVNNWLSELPDDLYVRELSIPGSHDAATGNGFSSSSAFLAAFSGITQSLSLSDQWEAGIRAYDLRPSYKENVDGKLKIYHGILETNVSLKAAFQTLVEKLKANPNEMVVVLLRHESESDNNSDLWSPAVANLLGEFDDFIATFTPDLTLGQARGKILILSRDNFASDKAGIISGWSHSENFEDQKRATIAVGRNRAVLYVQDFYECQSVERKLKVVETMLDYSTSYSTSSTWVINHTSGYTGATGTNTNVLNLAKDLHPQVIDILLTSRPGRTGIMLIDFAGVDRKDKNQISGKELVDMIVSQNRRYVDVKSSGIESMTNSVESYGDENIYDLHGRPLGKGEGSLKNLPKGIYIFKHKKLIIE